MSDRYDRLTDDEIRAQAKIRGIPSYKTDLFMGTSLRQYMRDVDYDEQRAAEFYYGEED